MPNPITAQWNNECEGCEGTIEKGEDIYFTDEGKLCIECATDEGYVCECGNFKKPDFNRCYDCATL